MCSCKHAWCAGAWSAHAPTQPEEHIPSSLFQPFPGVIGYARDTLIVLRFDQDLNASSASAPTILSLAFSYPLRGDENGFYLSKYNGARAA